MAVKAIKILKSIGIIILGFIVIMFLRSFLGSVVIGGPAIFLIPAGVIWVLTHKREN